MSAIKLSAQKVRDVSNLKKIAEAWREYSINRSYGKMPISEEKYGTHFIQLLSGCGENFDTGAKAGRVDGCILNDPYVYVSPGDKYASPIQNETIGRLTQDGAWYWSYPLKLVSNGLGPGSEIFSYCLAWGIDPSASLDTTPLGFTRGLKENGYWDEKYGLYGSKGGYVVFCDGHTTWFDGSKPAKFLKWDRSGYTNNIRETLAKDVLITCGYNVRNNVRGTDNSLLVTHHFGLAE
ncbi:MAG: hypothetical protein LBB05_02545 [Puniceicoccales bacterium]|jgi:hypothetical protein|nr:hypothetical protein [Puniceicoccales bacterium]